jgi:hypothetical protein
VGGVPVAQDLVGEVGLELSGLDLAGAEFSLGGGLRLGERERERVRSRLKALSEKRRLELSVKKEKRGFISAVEGPRFRSLLLDALS